MILLTGGSGRLGKKLQELMKVYAPNHTEYDFSKWQPGDWDLIIHSGAYTNVAQAEIEKDICFNSNVKGAFNISKAKCPVVFISSEYANNPINFYATTKLMGEEIIRTHPNHLIIRTLFKTWPFPYDTAYVDQYTQGDYIDVIAPLIVKAIEEWDRKSKTIYVGTGRKTMFDLAKKSKPDVKPISVDDIKTVKVPKDYL